jgi:translation initiation factor IF-3
METAKSRDLDLVEVAPNAKPPVCKIMDFGKYKYQLSKKQTQKKAQDMKEIKLRPRIDTADLERKVNNMKKFLEEGHKTKVTMFFRGRERGRPDLGMQVFDRLKEMLEGKYNIVNEPRFVGNSITMVVAPK